MKPYKCDICGRPTEVFDDYKRDALVKFAIRAEISFSQMFYQEQKVLYIFFYNNDTFQVLRNFYCTTIGVMFLIALIIQIPKLNIKDNIKVTVFVSWAAFGVIPTLHWYLVQGGNENAMVQVILQIYNYIFQWNNIYSSFFCFCQLFIPRVIGMYILVTIAFLIYITKIPERW